MKRLLCIISTMNSGGAETFLMKVYRKLDRSKYQMDFCINIEGKCFYSDEILSLGGRIFYIPSKSENVKEFKKQLSALIKREQYEYVLRVVSNGAGFMDLKIAKRAGAKYCAVRATNSSNGVNLSNFLHYIGRLFYTKYVDIKIAPSDLAAIYTFGKRAYQNGQVALLHNAVDLSVYSYNEENRRLIRDYYQIDNSKIVVGHVGRFAAQKNHPFLIEVFAKIHQENPNTLLLLVGGGELEQNIRAKVQSLGLSKNVIFAGVRSDVPALLSAMDVFVMPSFYEGMPNTVIEAQATGLPCVIADTITKEANITGLVEYLPLGDANEWAQRALAAIRDERVDTKGSFIANKYDIESVVGDFVKYVFHASED